MWYCWTVVTELKFTSRDEYRTTGALYQRDPNRGSTWNGHERKRWDEDLTYMYLQVDEMRSEGVSECVCVSVCLCVRVWGREREREWKSGWQGAALTGAIEPVGREADAERSVRRVAHEAHAEALVHVREREPPGVRVAVLARRRVSSHRAPPARRDEHAERVLEAERRRLCARAHSTSTNRKNAHIINYKIETNHQKDSVVKKTSG